MNITLWIFQGVIAAIFLMAGMMKTTQSKEVLKEKIGGWVEPVPAGTIKLIGILELLGAIGVILPVLLNFSPMLVPLAAIGLGCTMVGASVVHFKRNETKQAVFNLMILGMTAFVAYGRIEFLLG